MNTITIQYRKLSGETITSTIIPQESRVVKLDKYHLQRRPTNRRMMLALDVLANKVKSYYYDAIISMA